MELDFSILFLFIAGLVLYLAIQYRRQAGFRSGETISRDNVTLRSEEYGLVGRPDRIVHRAGEIIIEDKKSSARLYDSHRLQMGFYMILAEETYAARPTYAVVVLRDGTREKVLNTKELREKVWNVISQIRQARKNLEQPLPVIAVAAKCRPCSQRENCSQRVA